MLDRTNQRRTEPSFLGKVLLVALVVALAAVIWQLALVFILGFGSIIVAVTLDNLAGLGWEGDLDEMRRDKDPIEMLP